MRQKILFISSAFALALLLAFGRARQNNLITPSPDPKAKRLVVRCSPDWENLQTWLEESDIPPIPGSGTHTWKISTGSDSAQFYFNQGINMYYSFHLIEAMASFKKAGRFDPQCAMIYWAQALGYGPNINDYGYRASPEALEVVSKARERMDQASPLEKELIEAMSVRYTADSADATRSTLNQAYTDRMMTIFSNHEHNADVMALYADAMMLQHPWDLWTVDGQPKSWTPAIRELLEKLLQEFPEHPGGNHYYIHVMEPSPYAEKALPSAEILGKTNPGLAHVVHMPSHIYLRTGLYQRGVDVNISALTSYHQTASLYAPVTGNDFLYVIHNLHMKANNAMMTGNYKNSIDASKETQASIPVDYLRMEAPIGILLQYIYMTPVLADVRFGRWDNLLKLEEPAKDLVFARILYHFGRGMALAGKRSLPEARSELSALEELMKDSTLSIAMVPFSPPIDGAVIAENLLMGTINLKEGNFKEALPAFEEAWVMEDNMVYNEPRDWLLNPKPYMGHALLLAGRPAEARELFEKDLANNRENGWSLYGLWMALKKERKNAEAARVLTRFKKAFQGADVKLTAPVFY